MYRHRFGLKNHPLPKDAMGKTFFDKSPSYQRLKRRFSDLATDPGVGVLVADAGIGKTAAIRNLCAELPRPNHLVVYLCDTAVSPLDLYRTLALELGVRPSHHRAQLWNDIKKALVHLVDERNTLPLLVIDEAQHLSDKFLTDLSGFLNFAFDSRDLLTVWLVGLPPLLTHLKMLQHAALETRIATEVRLEALDRETFGAMVEHGLKVAGATQKLLADPALEQLYRASRGVPRIASRILRTALRLAHEKDQNFVDEAVMEQAVDEILLPLGAG
jgi:type II secretory pathway predicted ATPase ExeA